MKNPEITSCHSSTLSEGDPQRPLATLVLAQNNAKVDSAFNHWEDEILVEGRSFQKYPSTNMTLAIEYFRKLSKPQILALYRIFQIDFEMFDYDVEVFLQK